MNTYVPVRKIIKVVSTHRIPKRERHSSLQECLESSKESRRKQCRWKPWIILLLFSSALYVYAQRGPILPEMYERIGNSINVDTLRTFVPTRPDEYVTPEKLTTNSESTTISPGKIEDVSKNDTLDPIIEVQKNSEHMPFCKPDKPYGKVEINKTSVDIHKQNVYPLVKKGGYYHPIDCKPKQRVGIIVPYRDRKHNLGIFLYNIHPFLMRQKLEYQIFVIEQEGNQLFNKGRLYNAGFLEMMKFNLFHCVVFHDLDLLPMDSKILYTCPKLPRHMSAMVDDSDFKRNYNVSYEYNSLFGGVVSMSLEQFKRANGYSNLYFGWGGEDNDMYWRQRAAGYPVVRYEKSVGVYTVLPHVRAPPNPFRYHLLTRALERNRYDGITNLEYLVVSTKFYHLFTHILINVNPRNENITALNNKWG